jgi:hypothetical protein
MFETIDLATPPATKFDQILAKVYLVERLGEQKNRPVLRRVEGVHPLGMC